MQAGTPAAWVASDEVYGADPTLRTTVREFGLGYVLRSAPYSPTGPGRPTPADDGPKATATYARAWVALLPEWDETTAGGQHHLLIRRSHSTGELAYLRCWTPHPTSLATLARVARQRWRIEESFKAAKGLVGLDQHQVRRWTSCPPLTTLAMLAHAFLAVAAAIERDTTSTPHGLIELTVNEFRNLFDALLLAARHSVRCSLP